MANDDKHFATLDVGEKAEAFLRNSVKVTVLM